MERIRGFEVAKGFEDKEINLPERKTKYSAGYDSEAAEDVIIPSFKKGINTTLVKTSLRRCQSSEKAPNVWLFCSHKFQKTCTNPLFQ